MNRRCLPAIALLLLAACSSFSEEPTGVNVSPATCGPQMSRFPVGAPHNIGYDAASCGTGTCAVSCPDVNANSDWSPSVGHHGIDIFAHEGADLVAVAPGTITRVGWASASSGLRVSLRDDCGWDYYYLHMKDAVVSVGQRVGVGQLLGHMGGTADPPVSIHTHFNVSDGDYYDDIDPIGLLSATSPSACAAPPPPPPPSFATVTGDFDGDGRSDLATLSGQLGGGWETWAAMELSTGASFASSTWPIASALHMHNGGKASDYRTFAADMNGDGKADLVTLSRDADGAWATNIAVEISTGSGFAHAWWPALTPMHMRNGGAGADYRVVVADVNGDGRADLVTIGVDASGGWAEWAAVEVSTGSGFASGTWPIATARHMRNAGAKEDYRVLVADVNGDGKSDVVTVSPTAGGGWAEWAAVEISTGTGFASAAWPMTTAAHVRNAGTKLDYRFMIGDVNGDKRADLVTVSPDAGGGWAEWAAVELSTGSGFSSAVWPLATAGHLRNGGRARYAVALADLDGNGKADVVTTSPDGGGGWADWIAVELSTGSGFAPASWPSATPGHMRAGGADRTYRTFVLDVDGDKKSDLVTLSENGLGGWHDWISVDRSAGSAFASMPWAARTPAHLRNGGAR